MRRIYEQCSRVIVYLGADPIRPAARLRRQPLHEQEDYSPQQITTLRDLLQRKYFSRVWVIQELLLAPRVIFRIGDREFWASPRTGCRLTQEVWGGDKTETSWIQYIVQGSLLAQDILGMLHMTADFQASDPRDMIFGVLTLLNNITPQSIVLLPDYTLSIQQVFIGLFIYCVLELQAVHLLHSAPDFSTSRFYPSWIPNWTPETMSPHIFLLPVDEKCKNKRMVSK